MKHLLLALLLPTILLGQTRKFRPDNQIYVESNSGIGISGGKPIIPNFSTKDWEVSNLPFTSLYVGYMYHDKYASIRFRSAYIVCTHICINYIYDI